MAIAILSFTSANTETTKKASKAKKETVAMHYPCPMECEGEKTYSKNGKCPVCEMQMKPVKATLTQAVYQCTMKCEVDKTYAAEG